MNPSILKQMDLCESKDILVYIVSPRLAQGYIVIVTLPASPKHGKNSTARRRRKKKPDLKTSHGSR